MLRSDDHLYQFLVRYPELSARVSGELRASRGEESVTIEPRTIAACLLFLP